MKTFWTKFWNFLKNAFYVIAGSAVTAFALVVIIIPLDMAPGGVSGLAALINKVSGGLVSVGLCVILLNIPLFIAGLIVFGKKFIAGSLVGTVVYSVAIEVFERFMPQIKNYYDVAEITATGDGERILFAVVGGALMGFGYGLIFRGGATTGGTDILARLFQNKIKWLSLGQLVLIVDAVILLIIALAYKSINAGLYSAVLAFVSSKVIDVVEAGVNYAKHLYIITSKPDEISREIIEKLGRGVTKIDGTGMYSGKDVSVLMCVIYNKQIGDIKKIISTYDSHAFISIVNAREATLFSADTQTYTPVVENTELKKNRKEKKKNKKK